MSGQRPQEGYLEAKLNILNEMRSKNMTLQELRLFSVYLSKINLQDKSRVICFTMDDFKAIMELKHKNIMYFREVAQNLLNKQVEINTESGDFTMLNLFSVFRVNTDEYGKWYVEINVNDEALPLILDFKDHYFKHGLWNALRLKSKNQLRMYEVLKQYAQDGQGVIAVKDLKGMLGISEEEYPRFGDFKDHVLSVCQKALSKYTDISFTYTVYGDRGRGGKVNQLKFTITKNKGYIDPLCLDNFIKIDSSIIVVRDVDNSDEPQTQNKLKTDEVDENETVVDDMSPKYRERIRLFAEACENAFSWDEVQELNNHMLEHMVHIFHDNQKCCEYLSMKYKELLRDEKEIGSIPQKFKHMCTIIGMK